VLKQRAAHALLPKRKRRDRSQRELFPQDLQRAFWQARFYDFNVWTTKKRVEKLRYMHRNPVKRGLVATPEQWRWSSYRFYLLGESGRVRINEGWGKISFREQAA
jgi:REP element-mobilizing transposase RayT